MTEHLHLQSLSPETPSEAPSWHIHTKLFTHTELDYKTGGRLGQYIEASWPGSTVAIDGQKLSVMLAAAEKEEPSVETMIEYIDNLRTNVATQFFMDFKVAPDSRFMATPIIEAEAKPASIGQKMTEKIETFERPALSVVKDENER